MASSEHRIGECRVAVQAIFCGDQDVFVQGVTKAVARNNREHVAVGVGRVLIYIEDRAALSAWERAISEAKAVVETVFPWDDEIEDAQRRESDYIAKHGYPPRE